MQLHDAIRLGSCSEFSITAFCTCVFASVHFLTRLFKSGVLAGGSLFRSCGAVLYPCRGAQRGTASKSTAAAAGAASSAKQGSKVRT
jgi:hypothetical protein